MARLEDLAEQITDPRLRSEMQTLLGDLKRRQGFGLVFEEHVPETTLLYGLPAQIGSVVQRRDDPEAKTFWRVTTLTRKGKSATIERIEGGDSETVPVRDLLVVKRFGEPMYPTLTSVGAVRRSEEPSRPSHAVINGENFHALQLLVYQFAGEVDCIYIDPPYNTGARDWKYNNRYVDAADTWRHSKWLSFMEKRLRLAKRLLKRDGVLIVTIDEHEVHHLAMLLEKLFPDPDFLRYMITIIINTQGTGKANFGRVDEQALFVVPDTGSDVIVGRLRRPVQQPLPIVPNGADDDEDENGDDDDEDDDNGEMATADQPPGTEWEFRHLRRRGSESSYRHQRPGQFFPILIDEKERRVIRADPAIEADAEPDMRRRNGYRAIWPIDQEGRHRCWRFNPERMQREIDAGKIVLGQHNKRRDTWTLNIRLPRKNVQKLKTVWTETAYHAGTHGTELLRRLLGQPGLFPFPKSVYAVRDCLGAVVRERPNALIVDIFAGSGTTLHAACLLNAEDGGQRRTILVTNNEVTDRMARQLAEEGRYRGDAEFERFGIFEQVTRPRCEAVITGKRPDGKPIPGRHLDAKGESKGRPFGTGFPEDVEFFRLDYLDPDEVDLGRAFGAILPVLWLAAGGIGPREEPAPNADYTMPAGSTYAVLFKTSRFRRFQEALRKRPSITHVWLVTDSEDAFVEMRAALPSRLRTSMLPRDYLRHFRINTERNQ